MFTKCNTLYKKMLDRIILFPYTIALAIRNAVYRKGSKKVRKAEVPTICVGNITVGGTGKTPHTELILKTLLESETWGGRNVAMLSRGYKRASKGFQQVMMFDSARMCGDEPLQIRKKFPIVTVAVDADRIEGCDFLVHPEKVQTELVKVYRKSAERDHFQDNYIAVIDDKTTGKPKVVLNMLVLLSELRDLYLPSSMTKLGNLQLGNQQLGTEAKLEAIYYSGTLEEWNQIASLRVIILKSRIVIF